MQFDLFLKNGLFVTEANTFRGGLAIMDGKIAQLLGEGVEVEADRVIDLTGKTVLPGLVDGHAHFNEPGREHWEGYTTGSMAAAAGGVTTVLEMPLNSTPPTTNQQRLDEKRRTVEHKSIVDYAQWGGFVDNNLDDLVGMNQEGVIGFKAFISSSGVDFARIDDDLLFAGLHEMKRLGNLIGLHAENEWVTAYLGRHIQADGRTDRASWCQSRPLITELEAIERTCTWAKHTGGNLHIVHVSTADGIRAVEKTRNAGAKVTVETCPHYLFFDQADFERIGPSLKCAPPIRSREEVEKLWQTVLDGLVDTIGSDHSPCTWDEKAPGMENIWKAWGGISGIQSMLPALLTAGVHKRGLPLPQLVKLTSANPARLFGLYPQKGALLIGSDADLVVVDLDMDWVLTADQLFYKNKHSAYVGCTFKGKVMRTILRGQMVFEEDQIIANPGCGKLLRRLYPYNYNRDVRMVNR